MTGFELEITGVGSVRSTNCAKDAAYDKGTFASNRVNFTQSLSSPTNVFFFKMQIRT